MLAKDVKPGKGDGISIALGFRNKVVVASI